MTKRATGSCGLAGSASRRTKSKGATHEFGAASAGREVRRRDRRAYMRLNICRISLGTWHCQRRPSDPCRLLPSPRAKHRGNAGDAHCTLSFAVSSHLGCLSVIMADVPIARRRTTAPTLSPPRHVPSTRLVVALCNRIPSHGLRCGLPRGILDRERFLPWVYMIFVSVPLGGLIVCSHERYCVKRKGVWCDLLD